MGEIATTVKNGTLNDLSISDDLIWRRELFSGLRELDLIFTMAFGLTGFADILHDCPALTSLTLLPLEIADPEEIFPACEAYPNALPGLTSFKYLQQARPEPSTTPEHVASVCDFLRNKRHLQCLDVALQAEDKEDNPFLELLHELPALEVLGFNFSRGDWVSSEDIDIAFFERIIPARLSALRAGQPVLVHQPDLYASYRSE